MVVADGEVAIDEGVENAKVPGSGIVRVIAARRVDQRATTIVRRVLSGDLIADVIVEAFDANEGAVVLPLHLTFGNKFHGFGIGIPAAEIDVAVVCVDIIILSGRIDRAAAIGLADLRAALLARSDADAQGHRRVERQVHVAKFIFHGRG